MADNLVRKSIYFSEDLWEEIEDFRFDNRVKSEAENIRILVQAGIHLYKLRTDPKFVQDEHDAIERLNNQG